MQLDLEQWRDTAFPFYEVYPHEPVDSAGVELEVQEAEGLLLTRIATPAEMLVHDPSKRTDVCHDYVLFERFSTGGGHCEVGDTGFDAAPSRLHLIDMSERYVSNKVRSRSIGVCIPHAALGYTPGEEPAFATLELDSPKGRLLAAAQTELMAAQTGRNAEDTALIARTFVDLVRQLMLGQYHDAPTDEELPMPLLLNDYIATHLHRPDLDADMLTSAFGISRATLYRHFEAEGGVARHIRDLRLRRCFFELAGAKAERGQVSAIARRWHFTDPTHFNRIFRDRFGVAPSECLSTGAHPGAGAPIDQIRISRHWLDQIRYA